MRSGPAQLTKYEDKTNSSQNKYFDSDQKRQKIRLSHSAGLLILLWPWSAGPGKKLSTGIFHCGIVFEGSMAKLDRPLYGESATGTFARVLAYRKTTFYPSVAKRPSRKSPPSGGQSNQRSLYSAACQAWHALTAAEKAQYVANRPANLSGFNFFIKLFLRGDFVYLYYCIFGQAIFQLSTSPDQPAAADFSSLFPAAADEFPIMLDGAHSPQAWPLNRIYSSVLAIQNFLIDNKENIEG